MPAQQRLRRNAASPMKSEHGSQALGKIGHERYGMLARALADAVGRDQLGLGVDRDEGPLVAKPLPIVAPLKAHLLLADEGPDFIALDAAAIEIAHLVIGERGTAGPDLDHQAHDRIPVSVGHPLG
jgi:hypothetical protein